MIKVCLSNIDSPEPFFPKDEFNIIIFKIRKYHRFFEKKFSQTIMVEPKSNQLFSGEN